jgi:glutamate carboxypeptidase
VSVDRSRLDAVEAALVDLLAARGDAMYATLERYVAIPTGGAFTPGLDELRGILSDRLRSLGMTIAIVPGDERPAWLTLPAERRDETPSPPPVAIGSRLDGRGPRVLVAAHIDTVHDPHGAFRTLTRESATIARGPGAVDMKGGIVLAFAALEALAECGVPLRASVLLNSDEETGSFHSARAIEDAGRGHDVGIALEPASDNGGLVVERMGSGHFRIDCGGRTAHAGRDYAKGISAVRALARAILEVEARSDPDAGRIVNVGPLEGSLVSNAVPASASAWGNVRFRDPAAMDELAASFDRLNTEAGVLPSVRIQRSFARPAKPKTPAVERFALGVREAAEALGQSLPFTSTGGVCDGNILQSVGLPTLDTLGIRGGNLHRLDEFIEIPSLVERAQLLAIVLKRLCEGRIGVEQPVCHGLIG